MEIILFLISIIYLCVCISHAQTKNESTTSLYLTDDLCANNPCMNNGTCSPSDYDNGYVCSCKLGFAGQNCSIRISSCASNPCLHNGTCTEYKPSNSYICFCPANYNGNNCEICVNCVNYACLSNPCSRGEICSVEFGIQICSSSSVIGFGFTLRFIVFTGLTIVIFFLCIGIIVHFSRVKLCLMLKVRKSRNSSPDTTTIRRSTSDHVIYCISSNIDQHQQQQQPQSVPSNHERTASSQPVAPSYSEAIKFSVLSEKQDQNKEELLPSYQETIKTVS